MHPRLLRKFTIRRLAPALGLLALTSALVFAAPAAAANGVPNPGFESACGSPTTACSWPEIVTGQTVGQRDPTVGQGGSSASYRLERLASGLVNTEGRSECITPHPFSAGSALYSFWYRTTDPRVSNVRLIALFYESATCSGSAGGPGIQQTFLVADGEWQEVSLAVPIEAMFTSRPALVYKVSFACSSDCPGAQVHFDDLLVEQAGGPTAVRVPTLRAQRTNSGVRVHWRTASEAELLGFNVYRQQRGRLVKVNRELIPAVFGGTASGHGYSWLDHGAPRGVARYRLQSVSLSGTKSWAGTAAVAR